MTTALVWHELMMWFEGGCFAGPMPALFPVQPGEPSENPEAKRRIKNVLDATGYIQHLTLITPQPATETDLRRVHTERLITQVRELSAAHGGQLGQSALPQSCGILLFNLYYIL